MQHVWYICVGEISVGYATSSVQPLQCSAQVWHIDRQTNRNVVVVVIAQQVVSYRQLSRLRKSTSAVGCPISHALWVTSDGFDSWTDVLRSVVPLHTPDRHLICRWWCEPCNCSKADSDQVWYGPTEAADFQVVRYHYQVVKLQGLCLVQNSFLLLRHLSRIQVMCLYNSRHLTSQQSL